MGSKEIFSKKSQFFFWGLKNKMLFSFTIAFLLLLLMLNAVKIFGIPFLGFEGEYSKREKEVFKSISLVADLKQEQLLLWLNERREEAAIIAKSRLIQTELGKILTFKKSVSQNLISGMAINQNDNNFDVYKKILDHLLLINQSNQNIYEEIQIVEVETGDLLISTLKSIKKQHVVDRQKVIDFIESGNSEDIFFVQEKDEKNLDLFRKISFKLDKERVEMVLIMCIDTARFMDHFFLKQKELGNTGEVVLIDDDFKILTNLKYQMLNKINPKNIEINTAPAAMAMAALGQQGIIKSYDYRGKQVLAVLRNIRFSPELRWGMVVKKDLDEVYHPIRDSIKYSIIIGILIFLFSVVIILFISNRLTSSIKILMNTAEAIKEGDFSKRANIRSKDEIGFLAILFNSMVDLFQNWNSELEKEIKNQTVTLNKVNENLKKSEEKYRILFEQANDSIYLIDPDNGSILDCNEKGCQITGYSSIELKSMNVTDLYPIEERPQVLTNLKKIAMPNDGKSMVEMNQVKKDGGIIPVEINAAILDVSGKKLSLSICRDITDRKKSEAIIKEQTSRMEQYVYTASHDIKSPLISIQGYAKLMCDSLKIIPSEKEKQKEWLTELDTCAKFIKKMVDKVLEMEIGLLEYAKTRSLKPVYEIVLLKELLDETVSEIKKSYSERNPEIYLSNIPEKINYNSTVLHTIFSNLLINAIKYTPIEQKPKIKISFSERDSGYECIVIDNGIGIKEKEGDRIFDLFIQLDKQSKGHGVGLAIVRNFVEKYGGKISFTSKPGEGTAFTFTLPGTKELRI